MTSAVIAYDGYTAPTNGAWPDLSGNGNNGVLYNFNENNGWNTNNIYFDGTNYILGENNNPLYNGVGSKPDMTVEILFKKTSYNWATVFMFTSVVNSHDYMELWTTPLEVDGRGYVINYYYDLGKSGAGYILGWNSHPLNSMVKITMTKSGDVFKTYVDGVLVDTQTVENAIGFQSNIFSLGIAENGYNFIGNIYAVRVYSRALADYEISRNNFIDKARFNY